MKEIGLICDTGAMVNGAHRALQHTQAFPAVAQHFTPKHAASRGLLEYDLLHKEWNQVGK